eukprot:jgi/Tetstr1/461230/TSEL_000584.t1
MSTVTDSETSSSFRRLSKRLDADKFLYANEDSVQEELLCSVCFSAFVEPVIHDLCGVTFCRDCIDNRWISSCPSCRGPVRKENIHVNRMAMKMVEKLVVYCPRCNDQMTRAELELHLKKCVVKECPAGCGALIAPKHLQSHLEGCSARIQACPGAPHCCTRQLTKAQLLQHQPNCTFVRARPELEAHRERYLDKLVGQVLAGSSSGWEELSEELREERVSQVKGAMVEVMELMAREAEEATKQAKWMEAAALLSCAGAPHTPATNFLRGCCADALGDELAATQWYLQACAQGEARAWLTLHRSTGKDLGFDQDTMRRDVWRCHIGMDQIQVAFGWLRALADAGNAWGQFLLGSLLLKGIDGVQEKEAPQGVALLVRSVEGGFAAAQNALGLLHAKGEGMKQNLEESTRLYRLAAEQGNSSAQNNLGSCYAGGNGVKQDFAEAVRWFKLAAEGGHGPAQYNLGLCYFHGNGVKVNKNEAVKYFQRSADLGDADAQYNLAWCFRYGHGVERNNVQAVRLYRAAADQGNVSALYNLGMCYAKGRVVDENKREALSLFKKAAKLNDADAMYMLGLYCSIGEAGLPRDIDAARKYWEQAARLEHAAAKEALQLVDRLRLCSSSFLPDIAAVTAAHRSSPRRRQPDADRNMVSDSTLEGPQGESGVLRFSSQRNL